MVHADGKPQPAKPIAASSLVAGRPLFVQYCSACHGVNAEGGDGPDLRHTDLSTSSITYDISHGFKDEMPAFKNLSPDQLAALATYVHSLK